MVTLTPGLRAMIVNPCSASEREYCTVSMFKAALLILYAGVFHGNLWASVIELRGDELLELVWRISNGEVALTR